MLKRILKTAIIMSALTLVSQQSLAENPKREMRSTWFATVWKIDWPSSTVASSQKNELTTYLDNFESMNLNGMCFQVRGMADACYKSSYEPWSSALSGTRGSDPGWDPLAYCVEQCHARGIECYAWVNPFRQSSGTTYTTPQDKQWAADGILLTYGSYTVFNPGLPAARRHILNVIAEIIDNYQIDGILFDDYFYPNNIPTTSAAPDYNLYKSSGSSLSFGDWRRENVNSLMREIQDMIQEKRPDLRFGISPAGVAGTSAYKYGLEKCPVSASDWQYNEIFSDPLAWLSDGSIDFISPQIYWFTTHSTAPYEPIANWWAEVADHFGRHFYSSHSLSTLSSSNTASNRNQYITQIEINRKVQTPVTTCGSLWYSSKHFKTVGGSTEIGTLIHDKAYTGKSLVPVVSWKSGPSYKAPANASRSGSQLKWTAVSAGKAIMRYTVYAIPSTVNYESALAADGDGFDAKYLLGVTYSPSFTLSSDKTSGYWYAVQVYDGYGREHEAALIDYVGKFSEKVTLKSPVGGSTAAWSQTFTWSAASNASYTVEIAADNSFSEVAIRKASQNNSVALDLSILRPEKTYYWRVSCQQTGMAATLSDVASFRTPSYQQASAVKLISPVGGQVVEDIVNFEWSRSSNATTYRVEVSSSENFASVVYSKDAGNAIKLSEAVSMFGKGVHYWRVVAGGPLLKETTSATESFMVEKVAIGQYEPGYTVKRDPANYSVNEYTFENLWVRSYKSPYSNMSFENDGSFSRAMVAVDGVVYLTRRSENSASAQLYLDCYDGETGELLRSLLLTNSAGDAQVGYFPLNNICKDSKGNVVIANMVLNASSAPLVLHKVNLSTGELTKIAEVNTSYTARIDHPTVYGDVESGDFTVYGAAAKSGKITRWVFKGGELDATYTSTLSSFYPSSASNFGIAPRVFPLAENEVLVNAELIHPTIYTLTNKSSKLQTSLNNLGVDLVPNDAEANGACRFEFDGKYFLVYPWDTYNGDNGWQFALASCKKDMTGGQKIAVFPAGGVGTVNSTTISTPVDAELSADGNKANIYAYSTGNGLMAYRLSKKDATSVNTIDSDRDTVSFKIVGRTIVFNRVVDEISVYALDGSLLARSFGSDKVEVASAGLYVVRASGKAMKVIVR